MHFAADAEAAGPGTAPGEPRQSMDRLGSRMNSGLEARRLKKPSRGEGGDQWLLPAAVRPKPRVGRGNSKGGV